MSKTLGHGNSDMSLPSETFLKMMRLFFIIHYFCVNPFQVIQNPGSESTDIMLNSCHRLILLHVCISLISTVYTFTYLIQNYSSYMLIFVEIFMIPTRHANNEQKLGTTSGSPSLYERTILIGREKSFGILCVFPPFFVWGDRQSDWWWCHGYFWRADCLSIKDEAEKWTREWLNPTMVG